MGKSILREALEGALGSPEVSEEIGSTGRLVAVCLSKRRHDPKKNVQRGYIKKGVGLMGDSHAGTEKEVSLLATEAIQALCQRTGIVAGPGSFAENITTEGLELKQLPIGTEIQVGGARLKVTAVGKDPSTPHTYSFRGYSLLREEGIFCKVTGSGRVQVGDVVRIVRD
jgi:MOSC domain-containing protein YiiM